MNPENRQVVFWITVCISLVWYTLGMQESRSIHQKIFHRALFKKNPKLTIFYHMVGKKSFLTAFWNSLCDFLSFDRSHYTFS